MSFRFFLIFACICAYAAFSSSSETDEDPYTDHCSSIVPEFDITARTNRVSLPSLSTSYFTGWESLLRAEQGRTYHRGLKLLDLRFSPDSYETISAGDYKVHAFLSIRFPYSSVDTPANYSDYSYYRCRSRARVSSIRFSMNGFWSEKSRKLCMVGSAQWRGGDRDAVLKLKFDEENPTIYTGIVSGSLESRAPANSPAYFDSVSIFGFPEVSNYSYALTSAEIGAALPSRKGESLSLGAVEFCSVLQFGMRNLELDYAATESHGCFPFDYGDGLTLSPSFLHLASIQCSESEKKARFIATFQNYTNHGHDNFDLGSSVIGEVSWDDKNKMMIAAACRIMDASHHFGNAVGDCTMRFTLWYPSVLTVRDDAKIAGEIWSLNAVGEKINLASNDENGVVALPGLRYEYRELDYRERTLPCTAMKRPGNAYPDGQSHGMKFAMKVENKKEGIWGWGHAIPSWVGNELYRGSDLLLNLDCESESESGDHSCLSTNISYKMWIRPLFHGKSSQSWAMNPYKGVEITAEGEYDVENGYLCMMGCRKVVGDSHSVVQDCEVALELEFPPLNGVRGGVTKGIVRSTRAETDPLHFDHFLLESVPHYVEETEPFKWLMDLSNC